MSEALAGSRVQKYSKTLKQQHGPNIATPLCTKYTTTSVLQLPCTCGLQSAQQVAKETFFSKRGPPLIEIMETSLQKPSCIALVNAFRTVASSCMPFDCIWKNCNSLPTLDLATKSKPSRSHYLY
ncbi:hypothetical protein ACJW30_12G014300 [Castanea mollissima]